MARLLIVSGVRIYREGLREALMQSELAHAADAAGSLAETRQRIAHAARARRNPTPLF